MTVDGTAGGTAAKQGATVNLGQLARELADAAAQSSSGREARTLPHSSSSLRQTLIALRAGAALDDHDSPGSATLQVVTGTATLSWQGRATELSAGDLMQIPDHRHRLDATSDAAVLLTVAGQPVHD